MKQLYILILFTSLTHLLTVAQVTVEKVYGIVLNNKTGISIENAHITNLSSQQGTISIKNGYFEINGAPNDSINISCISYSTQIIQVAELLKSQQIIIRLEPVSIKLNEIVLRAQTWQQFKLEFVQKEWNTEQSAGVTIIGLKQYKGPFKSFKPTLITAITNPISFTHHLLNKKSRQKRKSNRYKKILQKSYYLDD